MDSTTVRAHACAAGAEKRGIDQALGRSRDGFSTKIHVLSDGLGNLLELALTGGQTHDVTQAAGLLVGKQASV